MRMFCHFIVNVIPSSTHSSSVIYAKCESSSATHSQNENKSPDIRKMRINCTKAVGKNHSFSSSTDSHFAYITTSFSFCEGSSTIPLTQFKMPYFSPSTHSQNENASAINSQNENASALFSKCEGYATRSLYCEASVRLFKPH